jgi:hypothetical protein
VKCRGLHRVRLHPMQSRRSEIPVTRTLALTTGACSCGESGRLLFGGVLRQDGSGTLSAVQTAPSCSSVYDVILVKQ